MHATYLKCLSRLIETIEAGQSLDTVGESLTEAIRFARPRDVDLAMVKGVLHADGLALATAGDPNVGTLQTVLDRHALSLVRIKRGTTARELLQLAALLAANAAEAGEPTIVTAAQRLGFWHIHLEGVEANTAAPVTFVEPDPLPLEDAAATDARIGELLESFDRVVAAQQALEVTAILLRVMRTERLAIAAIAAIAVEKAGVSSVARGTLIEVASTTIGTDAASIATRWQECLDTCCTPPALRLVTGLLVSDDVPHEHVSAVLHRAGNAGTVALFEQLTAANTLYHRRVFFDTIVEIRSGAMVLAGQLGHPQWYVVRNAACLLGAMKAREAEAALIRALSHADERVRVSVATALLQLDTSSGRRALESAISDSSSQVRRRVMQGLLATDGESVSAAVLSEGLDLERDPDVQLEVVATLRAMATPHAVQQLVRICSPSSASGKSAAFRRASIEALVALRPVAAAPLLRLRMHDRDPEIRAHAATLLKQLGPRSSAA